jgi:RNA recognition motif-containing protein
MSGRHFSAGKRQREQEQARKKKEKLERRMRKRDQGPEEMQMASVEEITGALPSVEEAMAALQPGAPARKAAPLPARLFVGGLSHSTTQESLKQAFAQYGQVVEAFIVTDRDTGDSRGFGFVTMKDRKDAPKAIEGLDDSELDGRTIVVNVATERQR